MQSAKSLCRLTLAVGACALFAGVAAAADEKKLEKKLDHVILYDTWHQLRSINHTLEMADHDYGGHRADAVHDIKAAEKQIKLALDHAWKKHKPKNGEKHPKEPPAKEPQKLSDAQLAEAIPELRATIRHLRDADHDFGGHREKAVKDLHAAVEQLELALKYSKTLNKEKP